MNKKLNKSFETSGIEAPVKQFVEVSLKTAGPQSLKNGFIYLEKNLYELKRLVETQKKAISCEVQTLKAQISFIQGLITRVDVLENTSKEKLRDVVKTLNKTIEEEFKTVKKKNLDELVSLQAVATQGSSLFHREVFTFTTKIEANKFLLLVQQKQKESIRTDMTKLLDKLKPKLKRTTDTVIQNFNTDIKSLKAGTTCLIVEAKFPEEVIFQEIPSDPQSFPKIDSGTMTETRTRSERRWYTLWLVNHEYEQSVDTTIFQLTREKVNQLIDKTFQSEVEATQESLKSLIKDLFQKTIATAIADIHTEFTTLQAQLQQGIELQKEGKEGGLAFLENVNQSIGKLNSEIKELQQDPLFNPANVMD